MVERNSGVIIKYFSYFEIEIHIHNQYFELNSVKSLFPYLFVSEFINNLK